MEIVIIVLLLASLFGVWLLSVRRKLETQEENIRNAMYQTLVQLSAEREALEGLAEFLGQTMDAETFRRMKHSLESAQTAGEAGLPEWVAEQQRELLRVQKKIAESLCISPETVKWHIKNMLQKTNFDSKTKLAVAVTKKNLIINGF